MVKKIISVVLASVLLSLTLSGCADFVKSMFSYWEGMSKSEVRELIEGELEKKYGEEFAVLNTYKRGGDGFTYLMADCSPKSSSDVVFEIEAFEVGGGYIMNDTYIQSIVGREMRTKAEQILSIYVNNFAVEVYVYGLPSSYDSGIRSANDATIENFTNKIPENNLSTIWFVFDKNEFNSDFDITASYVEEIVDEYSLTNGCIICCFASAETVEECKIKISSNHADYDYDIVSDMQTTLGTKDPYFRYYFKAYESEIDVSKFF